MTPLTRKTKKNLCAIPGCNLPSLFMCRLHWRDVPAFLKREIWTFKRNGNKEELRVARFRAVCAILAARGGGNAILNRRLS